MINHLKIILIIFSVGILLALNSCTDYVTNIKSPIDDVPDDSLYQPEDLPLLINGIKTAWVIVWDETSIFAGGLSDELEFTGDIPSASYPTFLQLDLAMTSGYYALVPTNNSTEAIMGELGRLRLHADTLIERIENRIKFDPENPDHMEWKRQGLYTAYFFGGMARYIWASYWSLEPNDGGGGVINLGPYIAAPAMYADAITRLDKALEYADAAEARIVNSFKAKIYIAQNKYAEAAAAAELGMAGSDAPFQALYNNIENNYWFYWAGPGRTQFHAADRFGDYVYNEPQEANRIPLYTIDGSETYIPEADTIMGGIEYKKGDTTVRVYIQEYKYTQMDAALPFLTWQENELIKAEALIRGVTKDNAAALAIINTVRASHGIDPLTDQDVTTKYGGNYEDLIYIERDKELCFTGTRLIDERRFPGKWHLPEGAWHFFPIGYSERKINTHF